MTPTPLTNLRLLDCALQAGGTQEIRGHRDNPIVVGWFADAGASWIDNDEAAWCSAFACGMAKEAGLYNPRTVRARNWLNIGPENAKAIDNVDDLLPGDIVVVSRGRKRNRHHVSVFLHHMRDGMQMIGGNQSNMVQPAWYDHDRFLSARRLYEAA